MEEYVTSFCEHPEDGASEGDTVCFKNHNYIYFKIRRNVFGSVVAVSLKHKNAPLIFPIKVFLKPLWYHENFVLTRFR